MEEYEYVITRNGFIYLRTVKGLELVNDAKQKELAEAVLKRINKSKENRKNN